MRRTEHRIARVTVAAGLAAGLCYLVARSLLTLDHTDLWLSIPVLLVEVAGFVGSALLAWALWPQPSAAPPGAAASDDLAAQPVSAVDVVVRVGHQGEHELRATLLALRSVANLGTVIVVDSSARSMIAELVAAQTSHVLLLDAGDVPATDIVARLERGFSDERVAVVQGLGVSFAEDSIEHGPHGRHDLSFERHALNPALGTRGCAIWTGSGSLVAVDALREAVTGAVASDSPLASYWAAASALLSAGWRIVAPGEVAVVAQRVETSESVVYAQRRDRVRAARDLLASSSRRSLAWRQRLALIAWCVRPLSGVRRAAFVGALLFALYAGVAPFAVPSGAAKSVLVAAWLTAFVAVSVGLALLSGWRLRPGDRARWSLLSISPVRNSTGLVLAMTGMTLVLLLRGVSDQFTHALGRLPRETLLVLIVVALWTLAMSLDVLRLLVRRTQRRGSARVVSSLPAILGERSAHIVDLSPHGAGLLSLTATAVGERLLLVSTIPGASGSMQLALPCVVHSVSARDDSSWRIGVKFGEVNDALATALTEYCSVEPMWQRLGVLPETSVTEALSVGHAHQSDADDAFIGKGMLRFLSLAALVGAVASAVSHNFAATRASTPWLGGAVFALAIAIGGGVLLGLISAAHAPMSVSESSVTEDSGAGKSSSSRSPDLAIR